MLAIEADNAYLYSKDDVYRIE